MRLVEFALTKTQWGDLLFLRPVPRNGDIWGDLSVLQGTLWGALIPVIPHEIFEQALLGHIMPLMRVIGPDPAILCKRITEKEGRCIKALEKSCILASKDCKPCSKLPICYEPPLLEGMAAHAAKMVALAWKEKRNVIVVEER